MASREVMDNQILFWACGLYIFSFMLLCVYKVGTGGADHSRYHRRDQFNGPIRWYIRWGSKLWSSPFKICNLVRRAESSCKTLYSSSNWWISMMLLMFKLTQYRILKQRDKPLLMSFQHLLMWPCSPLIDFKPITSVDHNSDLTIWMHLYTYEEGTGEIALSTCKIHLSAFFSNHTDR